MKVRSVLATGAFLAVVLTGSLTGFAMDMPPGPGPLPGLAPGGPGCGLHDPDGLRVLLNLLEFKISDSQQKQLIDIVQKYESPLGKAEEALINARANFGFVIHTGEFNEEKVRDALRKVSGAEEEIFILKAKMMQELKAVLNPEQVTLLKSRHAEKAGKPRGPFGFAHEMRDR